MNHVLDLVGDLLRRAEDLRTPAVDGAVQEFPHAWVAVTGQDTVAGQRGLVRFGGVRERRCRAPARPGRRR